MSAPIAGRMRGVTLVEVLIAVVVLSIGLLGASSLQLASRRANFESVQRSQATALAQDMIERMRANEVSLSDYTAAGAGRTLTGTTMPAVDCTSPCTPAQLAAYDLYEWEQALDGVSAQQGTSDVGGLVSPTGCISGPAGGDGVYTVSIAWRGLVALSSPVSSNCGKGSGRYDSPDGTQTDVFRRVLSITVYIDG